ncbi:hypothetical protein [Candidatus Chromulinivorax destructor]|uniref:OmpH family outer membrane protein n=1 Tax=Candidatus Chromulinivorax destructor TaxID=2066483 RepID=A0A345ZBS0_9BACT|nr:hypothetical protein [Candidatus Chromulinivorax destructor]AXK60737.1 hypothetical protein C0J27_03200 [Candidatus Chromulinivorax destructor]
MKIKFCVVALFMNILVIQASQPHSILQRVHTSVLEENNKNAQEELRRVERERAEINNKISMRVTTTNTRDQIDMIERQNNYKDVLLQCAGSLERKFDTNDMKKFDRETKIEKMHTLLVVRDSLYPVLTHQEDQLILHELAGIDQAAHKQNCFFMPSSQKIKTTGHGLIKAIHMRLKNLAEENNLPPAPVGQSGLGSSVTVVVHAHPVAQDSKV